MNTAKPTLPNAVAVLVLGILSILCSCFLLGLILGIIGLILSKDGRTAYQKDPDQYEGYGALNAGRVLSIIGVVLGGLTLFFWLILLAIGGTVLGVLSQFINW